MAAVSKRKLAEVLIHLTGWGFLLCVPLLFFANGDTAIDPKHYLGFAVVQLVFMAVFYLNYGVLIDRLLFRKRAWQFIAANIALIVLCIASLHVWHMFHWGWVGGDPPSTEELRRMPPRLLFFLRDAMMLGLTVGLSVAIKMTGNWYRTESEKQEIAKARTEAELQNLKSQLNPHFLFNTMNNIYALIAIDPDKAQYAVHGLSRLLRYVLYDNDHGLVPLGSELSFMQNYIELMKLRLPATVDLRVTMPGEPSKLLVAPLLFITPVENAFKHGVSADQPSHIDIQFRIEEPGTVVCTIRNSYHPKTDRDRSGSGIGIANLRKRLHLLYPDGHIFRAERLGDEFFTQLIINTKTEKP
ncbi:MAG: histidine kinase [Rikenellaceae bacterium]|nr:histidine kinase [Rikenellaceae bacterium]